MSPALILSTPIKKGAVAAAQPRRAPGRACVVAAAHGGHPRRDSQPIETVYVININSPLILNGARVALARSDTHDLREIENKNFSIPHLAGFR